MITLLDTVHFEAYVAACAHRAGVSVQWDEAGSVPRTNGKVMYLPRIRSVTDEGYLSRLRMYVKHETSHIVHTNFAYWQKVGAQDFLMFVVNLLEDNRIDFLNDDEYLGDRALSNTYYTEYAEKYKKHDGDAGVQQAVVAPLFAWDSDHRGWIPSSTLVGTVIEATLDKVGKARLAKLRAGSYGAELLSLRITKEGDTTGLLSLAKRILSEVYGVDPALYMKEENGKGKGKDEDKGKEEKEGDSGEADGEEDGEGAGKGKPADAGERTITVKEYVKKEGGEHIVSRTGIHCEADTSKGGKGYSIPALSDYKVLRWPDAKKSGYTHGCLDKSKVVGVINNSCKPLANSLRMKLQVRAKGRYEYGTKSGKLHTGSLHRLVSARNTAQESRVFRRQVTSDTLDTAVSVLVDCSGSMSGSKFNTATAAAISVALALRPLHITYNILGFTNKDGMDEPVIWVFNDWNESPTQEELIDRFSKASTMLLENTDGDAIAWANNYLVQRKEARKLLLVMSDGAPAGRGWAGCIGSYTKQVISDIEKRKQVEIYGVGIKDRNVERYYTKHCVINKDEELTPTILSILDKSL